MVYAMSTAAARERTRTQKRDRDIVQQHDASTLRDMALKQAEKAARNPRPTTRRSLDPVRKQVLDPATVSIAQAARQAGLHEFAKRVQNKEWRPSELMRLYKELNGDIKLLANTMTNPQDIDEFADFSAPADSTDNDRFAFGGICGDAVVDPGEACDDGNTADGDCCSGDCQTSGAPAHDTCAARIPILDGTTAFDSTCVTSDGPPHPGPCTEFLEDGLYQDLWYNYEATCSGVLEVTTCDSDFDTKIAIYDGDTAACADLDTALLDCNDDHANSACDPSCTLTTRSVVCATVTSGNTYKIRVGGWQDGVPPTGGTAGTGVINISCNIGICGDGVTEGTEECDDGNTNNTDSCGNDCILIECGNGVVQFGEECDDGNTANGDGCDENCLTEPLANDDCIDRIGIGDGLTAIDNTLATTDGLGHGALCEFDGQTYLDVWYNYTASCTGTLSLGTCTGGGTGLVGDAQFDTDLAIYDGCAVCPPTDAELLGCNDDEDNGACNATGTTFPSLIEGVQVIESQCYKIRVGAFGSTTLPGTATLDIICIECGDGVIAGTEACDDGNLIDGDGCDATCQLEICGNGITQPGIGETCDDGNTVDDDGCDSNCLIECGNGGLDGTEECDDGNTIDGDGCSSICNIEGCGNGIIEFGETCDDGNTANDDGCDENCLIECGNGAIDGSEECDDGNTASNDGCSSGCITEFCGDGITNNGGEACDDGNTDDGDCCSGDCLTPFAPANDNCVTLASALDGTTAFDSTCANQSGDNPGCAGSDPNDLWYRYVSTCTGTLVIDTEGSGFDTRLGLWDNCTIAGGVVVVCNDDGGTGLLSRIEIIQAIGTNHIIQVGGFNSAVGTGSLNISCNPGVCGDGVTEGPEGCDDGNVVDGDGCDSNCVLEICGNGVLQTGEECDDGNNDNGDGCDANCVVEPDNCDFCADAANCTVTDGAPAYTGSTLNNTDSGQGDTACGILGGSTDEWMQYTTTCEGTLTIDTEGAGDPDTILEIYESDCATLVECDDDDGVDLTSSITIGVGLGETYNLRVSGWNGGSLSVFNVNIDCALGVCGDGTINTGEECDDGNSDAGDGCSDTCQIECGNGVIDPGETCDDGNTTAGDGCDSTCNAEVCGNGLLQAGEECDDGNTADDDGCDSNCAIECGNGGLDGAEECDDGNTANGDGCNSNCIDEFCGDGIVNDNTEVCDDGNTANGDCCDNTCQPEAGPAPDLCSDRLPISNGTTAIDTTLACTDGVQHDACEFDGQTYNDVWYNYTATCSGTLSLGTCTGSGSDLQGDALFDTDLAIYDGCNVCPPGDGDLLGCNDDTDDLGCDATGTSFPSLIENVPVVSGSCYKIRVGSFSSTSGPGTATLDIVCIECGDGEVAGAEQCDDGNNVDGDGCDSTCVLEECGNGVLQSGETCDDGNTDNGDGCDSACQIEDPGACCTSDGGGCVCTTTHANACGGDFVEGGDCSTPLGDPNHPCDCNNNGVCDSQDISGEFEKSATVTCGIAIPDNDLNGISCDLVTAFGDGGVIAGNLKVNLNIRHTWQGDMRLALMNVTSGVGPIFFISRVGHIDHGGTSTFGYLEDDFGVFNGAPLVIDDSSGGPDINFYDGTPSSGIPQYTGPAVSGGGAEPSAVLDAFDGLDKDGTWRLFVLDAAGGDLGTLDSWGLTFLNTSTPNSDDDNMDGIPDECITTTLCDNAADCCDTVDDGMAKTDDVCVWCECVDPPDGSCNLLPKLEPSDMGGSFGACLIDGFCNIHDRTHALTCFSGTNTCASINIDAGGSFGDCVQDGFCNIHDANHALTCFAGTNLCVCGPAPEGPGGGEVVGEADIRLVAPRAAKPGELIDVQVFIDGDIAAFQAYQVDLLAAGGRRGDMTLVNVSIEDRDDYIFDGVSGFDAVNVDKAEVLAGADEPVATKGGYLATFTYQLSKDAAGSFVVDVLHNEAAGDQTFLISNFTDKVEVGQASSAVISVSTEVRNR
jgi:cysteine-rich repeat protein